MSRKRVGLLALLVVVALVLLPPGQRARALDWSIAYDSGYKTYEDNAGGEWILGGVWVGEDQFASAWVVIEASPGSTFSWVVWWKCGSINYSATLGTFNGQTVRLYGPWVATYANAPNLGLIGTSSPRSCELHLRYGAAMKVSYQVFTLTRIDPTATVPPGGAPGATNPPSPSPSPSGQTPEPTTTPGPNASGSYCDPASGLIGPCFEGMTPVPTICVDYIAPATPGPWNAPACAGPTPSPTPVPPAFCGPNYTGSGTFAFTATSPASDASCRLWWGYHPYTDGTMTVQASDVSLTVTGSSSAKYRRMYVYCGADPDTWSGLSLKATMVSVFVSNGTFTGLSFSGSWTGSEGGTCTAKPYYLMVVNTLNGAASTGTVDWAGTITVGGAQAGATPSPSPSSSSSAGPTSSPVGTVCPAGQLPGPVSGTCKPAIPYRPGASCNGPWPSVNPLDYAMWTGCLLGQVNDGLVNLGTTILNGLTDLLVPGAGFGESAGAFVDDMKSLAPFGYVSQVNDALAGAMAGAAGDEWSLAFTLPWFAPEEGGGTREVEMEVPTDIADGLAQFRWVLAALVWILGAVAVLRVLMRAVGGGGSVE